MIFIKKNISWTKDAQSKKAGITYNVHYNQQNEEKKIIAKRVSYYKFPHYSLVSSRTSEIRKEYEQKTIQ